MARLHQNYPEQFVPGTFLPGTFFTPDRLLTAFTPQSKVPGRLCKLSGVVELRVTAPLSLRQTEISFERLLSFDFRVLSMEDIQAVLLLCVMYWFTNEVINKMTEKRRALILKRIQKARNARYKIDNECYQLSP